MEFGIKIKRKKKWWKNKNMERKDLKELSFNLNLVLDEKTLKKVKKLNQSMCKKLSSEIEFEDGCVPHITILIFKVKAEDADKVCEIVWDFASRLTFAKLKLKKIRVVGNYIMLDVKNSEQIIKISQALENMIRPFIIRFSHWPITRDNKPHITLGWTKETAKATKLFDGKRFSLTVRPVALRLSDKYQHGTIHSGFRIQLF